MWVVGMALRWVVNIDFSHDVVETDPNEFMIILYERNVVIHFLKTTFNWDYMLCNIIRLFLWNDFVEMSMLWHMLLQELLEVFVVIIVG